jgi:hypothetical protein
MEVSVVVVTPPALHPLKVMMGEPLLTEVIEAAVEAVALVLQERPELALAAVLAVLAQLLR